MTTRNLDALFNPEAIAVIGASSRVGSVGNVVARNMFAGGFSHPIWPINPHEREIQSLPCYADVAALPGVPDLAVIATPPPSVPGLIRELGARGCRAAIVITAGLDAALRAQLLEAARPNLMRVVGPNCLGFLSPARGINASFSHLAPDAGNVAFLTQSGAIATSIIDWSKGRGLGFSHVISLGDMSDVDFGDLFDYLAADAATKSILLYAENITSARKFMSAARIAARAKPLIVVKAGRSVAGARAAMSHTGALAGADAVYDAAFRRAGMLRVDTLRDLFGAAETLGSGLAPGGDRLMVLTNGGGLGVLATDALEELGGRLAPISAQTLNALNATLPASWSHNNPVDILGDADGNRYGGALLALMTSPSPCDALLIMNCPTGVSNNREAAETVVEMRAKYPALPWLGCWMGQATTTEARKLLSDARIPNYETPDEAVRAFMQLADYAHNQEALLETPSVSLERDPSAQSKARAVVEAVLAGGRTLLSEPEAKAVLALYGIPIVETRTASSPQEAGGLAAQIGGNVALKILSRDITHKSDVGGVALDLVGGGAVEDAANAMLAMVATKAPHAKIDGFTVQAMISRPDAHELILGASRDQTFGMILMFGQGGIAAEIIADRVIGLPPLNTALARDMVRRTHVAKLLAGFRNQPPADLEAILGALVSLSDLVVDLPEIVELDINPLLADSKGILALDARVVVQRADNNADRLAIRPYPQGLSRSVQMGDASILMRPIRPSDAPALLEMARRTEPRDLYLRFHGAVGDFSGRIAARLSQIDYDREMAIVAVIDGAIAGVARLVFDPEFETAEYALIVRSDLHHRGIGRMLLEALLDYARSRGAKRVWGDVLSANIDMLALAKGLGATQSSLAGEASVLRTEFKF